MENHSSKLFQQKKLDSLQEILYCKKFITVFERFIVENLEELLRYDNDGKWPKGKIDFDMPSQTAYSTKVHEKGLFATTYSKTSIQRLFWVIF